MGFIETIDQYLTLEYDGKTLLVQYLHHLSEFQPYGKFDSKYKAYADCFYWANEYVKCCKQLEKWQGAREMFYFAWNCYDAIKSVMPYQVEYVLRKRLNNEQE